MSVLLRQIARYVARTAASSPVAKELVVKVARGIVEETKQISGKDDRAYTAGKAVRRVCKNFLTNR